MNHESITKKQIEILLLVYTFRFLHTYQLQQLLNHKKPNQIKVWLRDLTEKEYLNRDYKRHIFGENTKPALYSLTKKARAVLKTKKECELSLLNRIYRESERSQTFKQRCLLIADIYLSLLEQRKDNETIYFATQADLSRQDYLPERLIDAYLAITKPNNTKRYFLEIIDDHFSKGKIIGKIRKYVAFYESGLWEENTDAPFPAVVFICPHENIQKWLQRVLTKKLEEEQIEVDFYVTTSFPVL